MTVAEITYNLILSQFNAFSNKNATLYISCNSLRLKVAFNINIVILLIVKFTFIK